MDKPPKQKPSQVFREEETKRLAEISSAIEILKEKVSVVLVEPKYDGNIGATARTMNNCGLDNLIIVNHHDISAEAYKLAMHSSSILDNARHIADLSEIREEFKIIAGTSSVVTFNGRKFRRISYNPAGFWKTYLPADGKIALVFGREDDGLRNYEIEQCDSFIHIPSNAEYPVYNLSHSVAVILYEMLQQSIQNGVNSQTSSNNISLLVDKIVKVMELTSYPDYKSKNTTVMLRRMFSRAALTDTEYHKLMGLFRYIIFTLDPDSEG
ncbi:MAG: RNA methyltransferase [Thermoplasmata archaeon]